MEDKKEKSSKHVPEQVETPEPPQVMDPSKAPHQNKKTDSVKKRAKPKR
jgi:hypothetical protein